MFSGVSSRQSKAIVAFYVAVRAPAGSSPPPLTPPLPIPCPGVFAALRCHVTSPTRVRSAVRALATVLPRDLHGDLVRCAARCLTHVGSPLRGTPPPRHHVSRVVSAVPLMSHVITRAGCFLSLRVPSPSASALGPTLVRVTKGGAPRKKLTLMRVTPDTKNAKNHTKTKPQRPSRPPNEAPKADS